MFFYDSNYREEQKKRQLSWEMLKYLRMNPQLIDEKNREIYECFREVQVEYFIREGAENSREELITIVEFLADMEIKHRKNRKEFSQKELDTMYLKFSKI